MKNRRAIELFTVKEKADSDECLSVRTTYGSYPVWSWRVVARVSSIEEAQRLIAGTDRVIVHGGKE